MPLSYQILPNIIFIFAVLGIILIILRHLPEAADLSQVEEQQLSADQKLASKGLPAVAISKTTVLLKFWVRKTWHFVLEAKDLRPTALTGYKIKKIFGQRGQAQAQAQSSHIFTSPPAEKPEVKNEAYFLEAIKRQPKNLDGYDALGKFYLDTGNFTDAKDIYAYLTSHKPSDSDYQAKLAHSLYKLGEYGFSAEHYQKSLALDSTQPNRYYNLGLALEAAGRFPEAVQAFRQAISLEPGNGKFHISLSNVYVRMGNKTQGQLAAQRAEQEITTKGSKIKIK